MTQQSTHTVYLHLGSNIGERLKNLYYAIFKIEEEIGLVTKKSSIWKTAAWGVTDQPDFYNQAIEVKTTKSPEELLLGIQSIEDRLGRIRREKWGTRTIDIDIIFYSNLITKKDNLTIPHKFMSERNFVLYPLAEICPDFVHPSSRKSVIQLKKECKDDLAIAIL